MSIISGLIGNATEISPEEIQDQVGPLLIPEEKIETSYKLIRDLFIFTDKRLILIDKQGMTGKKVEYWSLPYKNISHFSTETSGHFDLDSELRIWLIGNEHPVTKDFKRDSNIEAVQKTLAHYVLKA